MGNNAARWSDTPPEWKWRIRRHPVLSALACGIGAPITLLTVGIFWLKDIPFRQEKLSGPRVIQENVYASVVTLSGGIAMAALAFAALAATLGEGNLLSRLFANWVAGTSTLVYLASFVSVGTITYFHLFDD